MSETTHVVLPYESMDPLAIGATDDESKKRRDTLEIDIPSANLVGVITPSEPSPVADTTEAARLALASPVDGPAFADLLAGKASVAVIIDNQFRPTPSSRLLPAVFDAIEAAGIGDVRVCCANGKVFPMSESDMEQKLGRENLARMESNGWPFRQNDPQNPEAYTFVGISSGGTPVWLLREVASAGLKITIGQAQANHWGAGGGGKLILPGVVSDETVESNHCAFVTSPQTHYGAYVGPMRSDIDEVATMCGLDCTMNVLLDTHLTLVTLEENLAMAAEIGLDATTSLDGALAAAFERHGADARVVVLPFARYQLPRNAIRMASADAHVFAYAGT